MTMRHRNSARTRCGQVWTLSSPGPVAFLIGTSTRLPAGAARRERLRLGRRHGSASSSSSRSAARRADQKSSTRTSTKTNGSVSTRAARDDEREHRSGPAVSDDALRARPASPGSERGPGEAVAPDAPEVHGHEEARDERDEDAVQDVEAQQRVRADLAAAEEEGARVVDRVDARDSSCERPLVAEQRRRARPCSSRPSPPRSRAGPTAAGSR